MALYRYGRCPLFITFIHQCTILERVFHRSESALYKVEDDADQVNPVFPDSVSRYRPLVSRGTRRSFLFYQVVSSEKRNFGPIDRNDWMN